MKLIILLISFSFLSWGSLEFKDGNIQAFIVKDKSLKELLIESANLFQIRLVIPGKFKGLNDKVYLRINKPISQKEMTDLLSILASERGISIQTSKDQWWVKSSRDMRYYPTKFVETKSLPNSDEFVLYYHKLKNPLGKDIARNLRPFLSRYGRVISFGDGHSIILSEQALNIKRLIKVMDVMDKKIAVSRKIKKGKDKNRLRLSDYRELKNQNEELMVENKILRGKMGNKGEQR